MFNRTGIILLAVAMLIVTKLKSRHWDYWGYFEHCVYRRCLPKYVVRNSPRSMYSRTATIKDVLGLVFCTFKRGCPLFRRYKCIVGLIQKQAFGTMNK